MFASRWVLLACCGLAPLLALASPAEAGHCHRNCCCCVCCPQEAAPRRTREAEPEYVTRTVAAAPIVSSVPMFAMPMMYGAMPVMPTRAVDTREAQYRGAADCCERVDRLEEEMKRLAEAVRDLQRIVDGQTDVLRSLQQRPPAQPAP